MKKTTVLHLIETIGVGGGAEVLLANSVPDLSGFNNVVVTLYPYHQEYDLGDVPVHCLNIGSKPSFLQAIAALRKIIRKYKVDLIHAHLFWAVLLARLAKPTGVRLVVSIHSIMSVDLFRKRRMLWLEKWLMRRQEAVIAVSDFALQDYLKHTGFQGKTYVLYNFVPEHFFLNPVEHLQDTNRISCVGVGHFKPKKNQAYLAAAFKGLPPHRIHLDLYGEGPLEEDLRRLITEDQLSAVHIAGLCDDMNKVLRRYAVFLSASEYEGFGIALVEAMAAGLACFVSDIPVYREVGADACIYFDINQPDTLRKILVAVMNGEFDLNALSIKARKRALEIADKQTYLSRLQAIYQQTLQ